MPTLVILAAGLGTRFGGDKQTARLGAGGASLMEYSIYDAMRAGFGRIVVVVRPDMVEPIGALLGARVRGRALVTCVPQELSDVPAGSPGAAARSRPWGTAHALLAARGVVDDAFAVANADDFYGYGSYTALATFLSEPPPNGSGSYAVVGFPLRSTLSAAGPVNRALCRSDDSGQLQWIEERTGLTAAIADAQRIGGTLVSMNLWGFSPAVFEQLGEEFVRFLESHARASDAEFLLPAAVQSLIAEGRARVRVLPSTGEWCGVTYAADATSVAAHLELLTTRGDYPRDLWG